MNGIKAIIFDFDGTLADSYTVWKNCINIEVYKRWNIDESQMDFNELRNRKSFMENVEYLVTNFNLPASIEEVAKFWNDRAKFHFRNSVQLKPGAEAFIDVAASNGILLAIGSNNAKALIEACLDEQGLIDKFTVIRGSESGSRPKPYPDIYLKIAQDLGVMPSECLVFEDALNGILAAKAAGMTVFGIYEKHNEKYLSEIKENCDKYFNNFNEALSLFKKRQAI